MVDKNKIVDDYYIGVVPEASKDAETSWLKKKLKLVSKKTDILSVPEIIDEKKEELPQENKEKIIVKNEKKALKEVKPVLLQPILQPILDKKDAIIKSNDLNLKSKFKFKSHAKNEDEVLLEKKSSDKKFENKKQESNNDEEKKVFKFWKASDSEKKLQTLKDYKKPLESFSKHNSNFKKDTPKIGDVDIIAPDLDEVKSSFKFNKPWLSKDSKKEKVFSDENLPKRKGLFKKQDIRKPRNLFDVTWDREQTFTRSNKISGVKKEKKNTEEIVNQNLTSRAWEEVIIQDVLSLKELSEKIGIQLSRLIAEFMKNGMMVNINSKIDFDSASIIAGNFDIKLLRDNSWWISASNILSWNIADLLKDEDITKLTRRPPVVSIMWHVDHGKTSLLDYIRNAKVAQWEAWWITQSIWAYQVEHNWQRVTFLDTPWHEAFTVMRARWAKSTDIAVLVVAADEWVKPQTVESINHAKEAWIPVVVAINKMDKEWANPDNVKSWLSENWLIPEDWGWDVPMIPVSAKTWFWIDDLLGVILLIAEMQDYKANRERMAVATVIESHLDQKLGPVATVLINTWNIKKWDSIVCKDSFWKVKVLKDFVSRGVIQAYPWDPVLIIWLDKVVEWWDVLQVVADIEIARTRSIEYSEILHNQKSNKMSGIDLIMLKIKTWNMKNLKVVVKADTNWSLEAIKSALAKQSTPETTVSVIHHWVGSISESDILMCQWSEAILVWFRVSVLPTAKGVLETSKVEFINSEIIYHITEKIEKVVTWMLDTKEVETILGKATVWGIFYTSKEFMIIWLKLKEWSSVETKAKVRVIKWDKFIWKWDINSLKQWVEEVKKVEWPTECWIKFIWNCIPEIWDILEIYRIDYVK